MVLHQDLVTLQPILKVVTCFKFVCNYYLIAHTYLMEVYFPCNGITWAAKLSAVFAELNLNLTSCKYFLHWTDMCQKVNASSAFWWAVFFYWLCLVKQKLFLCKLAKRKFVKWKVFVLYSWFKGNKQCGYL